MSHELLQCYLTGKYKGSHAVFVVQVEATENPASFRNNFEDFLNSHSYKVIKVQTARAANFVASELKHGNLYVDPQSIKEDSEYVDALNSVQYSDVDGSVLKSEPKDSVLNFPDLITSGNAQQRHLARKQEVSQPGFIARELMTVMGARKYLEDADPAIVGKVKFVIPIEHNVLLKALSGLISKKTEIECLLEALLVAEPFKFEVHASYMASNESPESSSTKPFEEAPIFNLNAMRDGKNDELIDTLIKYTQSPIVQSICTVTKQYLPAMLVDFIKSDKQLVIKVPDNTTYIQGGISLEDSLNIRGMSRSAKGEAL